MSKVYVLTRGEYSDYSIIGVFTTEQKCQAYRELYYSLDGECEEYELDPEGFQTPEGLFPYTVMMSTSGNVVSCRLADSDFEKPALSTNIIGEFSSYRTRVRVQDTFRVTSRKSSADNVETARFIYIYAASQEHAVKIANEKRAQAIANGEWE